MVVTKVISATRWKRRKNRIVVCDACKRKEKTIFGFCVCGMCLIPVDEIKIVPDSA